MSWTLAPNLSASLLRYYFGPDHKLKQRLWSWLHRLCGSPRFTIAYGRRAWLSLDIHDFIQFEILKEGFYEPEVWEALSSFAAQDEVVWDVGANIGSVGILAAVNPRVKEVHCFEPSPKTFADLERNCRLNPRLKITAHSVALSERSQVRPLFLGLTHNTGVAGFSPTWNAASVPVRCVTGDEWIEQGNAPAPTLIKIDVEGAEELVLRGLAKTLKNYPPKAIILEGHRDVQGTPLNESLHCYLKSLGYRCRQLSYPDDRATVNYLATPHEVRR